jgi:hypothetical protein
VVGSYVHGRVIALQPLHPSPDLSYPPPWTDVAAGPPQRAQASTPIRILAVAGGLAALLVGSILSLGLGLVAVVGLGATALLWRARNARLTRRASWLGSVLAACIVFGGFCAWVMGQAPGSITENMRQAAEQADREPPPPLVRSLQRFAPPPDPRVQSGVRRVTRSTAFAWWTMAMVLVLGSVFFGLAVGTPAWGCAMLIGYGMLGRWPMTPPAR